jgi:hypothetical protein
MLAEAKEIPIFCKFKQLGRNYVSRCYTSSNHPMVQLLGELAILVDNPGRGENEQPWSVNITKRELLSVFNPIRELSPSLQLHIWMPLLWDQDIFWWGRQIKEAGDHNEELQKIFYKKMRTSKCFTIDGLNMVNKPFIGFTLINLEIQDG